MAKSDEAVIAIDLRTLDTASRYRGIGMYTISLLEHLLPKLIKKHRVVIYAYDSNSLSDIDSKLLDKTEIRIAKRPLIFRSLPHFFASRLGGVYPREFRRALKLPKVNEADIFFQPEVSFGIPSSNKVDSIVVAHDIIPYLFADKYFDIESLPSTFKGRLHKAHRTIQRKNYTRALQAFNKAAHVIAVSRYTKKTLVDSLDVAGKKISIMHSGVPVRDKLKKVDLPKKLQGSDYLFYVGGIDYRRDLDTLVEAFEQLRAYKEWKLVFAGRDFKDDAGNNIRRRIAESPYKEDILNLGYVDENMKKTLLESSVALVYPTLSEGFGLPILEAFRDKCPVITYDNSAVSEAGGNVAIYVDSAKSITKAAKKLRDDPHYRQSKIEAGSARVKKFSWTSYATEVEDKISSLLKEIS